MAALGIAHISTFSPTQCGLATYTEDLIRALPAHKHVRVRLTPEPLVDTTCLWTIHMPYLRQYDEAATALNSLSTVAVVSLQHEFGIFGGLAGEYVLRFVRCIKKPFVTTLHSVRPDLSPDRVAVLRELCALSAHIVVLTWASKDVLMVNCRVPSSKITVIPHGIPDVGFRTPDARGTRPTLFVSAGHLRCAKGYEFALQALARYKEQNANFVYLILGRPHPQSVGAKEYYADLRRLAVRLGLEANVRWRTDYLAREDLLSAIMEADIGIVPYTREHQSASGILALLLGCGRAVVATSFACARSLHEHVPSLILVRMNDPDNLHDALVRLASDDEQRLRIMDANYRSTRSWVWTTTGQQYEQLLRAVEYAAPASR